jgi:hypothetical protein
MGYEGQKKRAAVENCLWMELILCRALDGFHFGLSPDLGHGKGNVPRGTFGAQRRLSADLDLQCSTWNTMPESAQLGGQSVCPYALDVDQFPTPAPLPGMPYLHI